MLKINVYRSKRFGLELWLVKINGVVAHEYLSREMAMTAYVLLKQKYSATDAL